MVAGVNVYGDFFIKDNIKAYLLKDGYMLVRVNDSEFSFPGLFSVDSGVFIVSALSLIYPEKQEPLARLLSHQYYTCIINEEDKDYQFDDEIQFSSIHGIHGSLRNGKLRILLHNAEVVLAMPGEWDTESAQMAITLCDALDEERIIASGAEYESFRAL